MKQFARILISLLLLLLCACAQSPASTPSVTGSEDVSVSITDTDSDTEISSSATDTDEPISCDHTFGEWETVTEAGEGTEGLKKHVCTLCGEKESEIIPALPVHTHNYTETVYLANCEEDGFTQKTCDTCGDSIRENIVKASGHKYGDWEVNIPATYDEKGEDIRTCSVCGDMESRTVNKLQRPAGPHIHSYTETEYEATCTEDGYTELICSCGQRSYIMGDPAIGHSFGEWYMTLSPIGMYGGLERRDCDNCADAEMRTAFSEGSTPDQPDEENSDASTDPEASDVSVSGSSGGSASTDGGNDDTEDTDTPEDLPIREFTYYNQRDTRWGNVELGCGTMKSNGCGPSSIAIALSYFGIDVTPYDVALWLYTHTIEFNHAFHGISATGIKLGLEHYGRKVVPIASYEEFTEHLRNGAVVVGAQGQGHFVTKPQNSHCIVMFGLDEAGTVQCYDPYTERLNGRYTAESLWEERSRKEVDVRYEGVTHFAVY